MICLLEGRFDRSRDLEFIRIRYVTLFNKKMIEIEYYLCLVLFQLFFWVWIKLQIFLFKKLLIPNRFEKLFLIFAKGNYCSSLLIGPDKSLK